MTWSQIIQTAKSNDSLLWDEGRQLLLWADKNSTKKEKENFVEWVDGVWAKVSEVMPQCETNDFFENAPSWEEL